MPRSSGLPLWVDAGLIPLLNLATALLVSGLVVVAIGENPFEAIRLLLYGAFGFSEAVGYTLFYTTNFIFTGLAVAFAYHAGLFNIGAEGQAYLGGLGAALVGLVAGGVPWIVAAPLAVLAAMLFGAVWGWIPGWLQARRGSHVVITTILLNFVAASLMTYLLVNVLIKGGQQAPETDTLAMSVWMPQLWALLAPFGLGLGRSPLNISLVLAILCAAVFWFVIWRSRLGYELRVVGHSERAAVYGGISPARITMLAMAVSGALAGLVAANEILGSQHRLILNFTGGYGFVGIAVALMGRNHPVGIVLAALLFGALYQGGSELAFDMPRVSRDLVVVIQGLVILFAGAFEHLFRRRLQALFRSAGRSPMSQPA